MSSGQRRRKANVQRPSRINVPMEVDMPPSDKMLNSNSTGIVLKSDSRKRRAESHDGGNPSKRPWFDKHSFNRHHEYHSKELFSLPNTKLVIQQIPPELNNIGKLNEHFSKFGTIVSLQVAYNNDPEEAFIQFSSPEEAKRAFRSTEPVLNNSFIKVRWHREDEPAPTLSVPPVNVQHPPSTTLKESVEDPLGSTRTGNTESPEHPSHSSQLFSSSTGHAKRFYNPAALTPAQKAVLFRTPADPEDALKKKQELQKLLQDIKQRKQELLEENIQAQKLLISKLENKRLDAKQKAEIKQMLTSLTNTMSKLQEPKGICSTNALQTSDKTQAQQPPTTTLSVEDPLGSLPTENTEPLQGPSHSSQMQEDYVVNDVIMQDDDEEEEEDEEEDNESRSWRRY